MSEIPKACSTCEHSSGSECARSGLQKATTRQYPNACDKEFSGWDKRLGIIERIVFWWSGK